MSELKAENQRLRRELRQAELEREILKKPRRTSRRSHDEVRLESRASRLLSRGGEIACTLQADLPICGHTREIATEHYWTVTDQNHDRAIELLSGEEAETVAQKVAHDDDSKGPESSLDDSADKGKKGENSGNHWLLTPIVAPRLRMALPLQ